MARRKSLSEMGPYAPNGRAGHRPTQPNRWKSPSERQTKAGTARSGGLIVEPPCCAGSDGVRTKSAPDSQWHRQIIAPIKKRQTATQALEPPALHRKGRTDEAHNIQEVWPGPSCAQPGRSRSGCRSTPLTRLRLIALGRAAKRSTAASCGNSLGCACASHQLPRQVERTEPHLLTYTARWSTQSVVTAESCHGTKTIPTERSRS